MLSYKWLQESELAVPGPLSLIGGLLYSHIKLGLKHFNMNGKQLQQFIETYANILGNIIIKKKQKKTSQSELYIVYYTKNIKQY